MSASPIFSPPGMSSGIITMSAPSQPSSRPASGEFEIPLDPEAFSLDLPSNFPSSFDDEFDLISTQPYRGGSMSTFNTTNEKLRRTSTQDSNGFRPLHSDSWKNYLAPPVESPAPVGDAGIQRPKSSIDVRTIENTVMSDSSMPQGNPFLMVEDYGQKQARSAPGSVIMSHRELDTPETSQFSTNTKTKDRRVTKLAKTTEKSGADGELPNFQDQMEAKVFEEKRQQIENWRRRLSNPDFPLNSHFGLSPPVSQSHGRAKSISDFGQFSFNGARQQNDVGLAPDENIKFEGFDSIDNSQNTDHMDTEVDDADSSPASSPPPDFAHLDQHFAAPWKDDPRSFRGLPVSSKDQPLTAKEAMARFERMARDIETASRAATFGSRRMSAGDIEARMRELSFQPDGERITVKPRVHRGSSIFESIARLKRGASVLSDGSHRRSTPGSPNPTNKVDSPFVEKVVNLARTLSKGRRPPKLDTNESSSSLIPQASDHLSVRPSGRARSKSDAGAMNKLRKMRPTLDTSTSTGLAAVWRDHGGPPTIPVSPISPRPDSFEDEFVSRTGSKRQTPTVTEEADQSWATSASEKGVILTLEYFMQETRREFPRLDYLIVERIAGEQVKRYKALVEYKNAHTKACNDSPDGRCKNGAKCRGVNTVSSPAASHRGHTPVPQSAATQSSNVLGPDDDDLAITRDFPPNIPPPPVTTLPAEFECPICFQIKSIQKPSDWTKHVHEDVQPFTCTFKVCPGGKDPKSDSRRFKRKADWVRHENERHRRPEWWSCNLRDCTHVCYRRDNFVKHLVREHRMTDPQVKAVGAVAKEEIQKVEQIVKACHQVTDRTPAEEACRFCGDNKSTNWKKLTVHLAGHMEKLALPILEHVLGALPPRKLSEAEERRKQSSIDQGHAQATLSPPRPPTTHVATTATSIPNYMPRRDTSSSNFSPLSSPIDPTPSINLNGNQAYMAYSNMGIPYTAAHTGMPQMSSIPSSMPTSMPMSVSPHIHDYALAPNLSSAVHLENTRTSTAPNPQLPSEYQPSFTEDYHSSPYDLQQQMQQQGGQQMYFNQSFAPAPVRYAAPPMQQQGMYPDETQQWQQNQY